MWFCHGQLVDDSGTEHIDQVTTEVLGMLQRWSSWQVEEEKFRLRLRQEQRRCPHRLKELFFSAGVTGVEGNPSSSWGVEHVASIVLRDWVVPYGSQPESVGICMSIPRLWSLTRLPFLDCLPYD